MAIKRQVLVTVSDDLNGKTKGVETVRFALGDSGFEIDLTLANRRALERSLSKYVNVARPIPPKASQVTGRKNSCRTEIRAWARENGFTVADKGRIATDIVDAYTKATSAR